MEILKEDIIDELMDPITLDLLEDPVSVNCCGRSFSRDTLKGLLGYSDTCPNCKGTITTDPETAPKNLAVANMVELAKGNKLEKEKDDDIENMFTAECSSLIRDIDTCANTNTNVGMPRSKKPIVRMEVTCHSAKIASSSKTLLIPVVDTSGSMSGSTFKAPIQQAKFSLERMMESCKNNKTIIPHIIGYHHSARIITNPSELLDESGGTDFVCAFNKTVEGINKYKNAVDNVIVVFLTDGQCGSSNGQAIWMKKFREDVLEIWDKPFTVHTVGFGSGHDAQFLDNIRKLGTVEGSYRFADPNDNADSLYGKINSVMDSITKSAIVPLKVDTGKEILEVNLIDSKAIIWLHYMPNNLKVSVSHDEFLVPFELEETSNYPFWLEWYSHLTDSLIGETIIFEKDKEKYDSEDLEIYGQLLLKRSKAITKFLSNPPYELDDDESKIDPKVVIGRLGYVGDTIKEILAGHEIDKYKLLDAKYEGQFATKTSDLSKKLPVPQSFVMAPTNTCVLPSQKLAPLSYFIDNSSRFHGGTPLHEMVCKKSNAEIEEVLKESDVYAIDEVGNTCLAIASSIGRCHLVDIFLKKDSSGVNIVNNDGETALDLAVKHGYWNTVQILLDNKAHLTLDGRKLVHTCLAHKFFNTAQKLVSNELADITKDDMLYFSAAEATQWLMSNVKVDDRTRDLTTIQRGITDNLSKFSLKEYDFKLYPEIFEKSTQGHLDVVEYLLKNGIADATKEWKIGNDTQWPLYIACDKGNTAMAQILINYSEDIFEKKTAEEGRTCLWVAASNKNIDIVLALLSAGANPNTANSNGDPPHIPACQKGSDNILQMLVDAGANIALHNPERDNSVMICSRNGKIKCLEILLIEAKRLGIHKELMEYYADIDGFDSFLGASEQDRSACMELLHKFGADIERKSCNGNSIEGATAVHVAAKYGCILALKTLKSMGCDLNVRTEGENKTALHFAIENKHIEVTRYLMGENVELVQDSNGHLPTYYASVEGNEDIYHEFFHDPFTDILVKLVNSTRDKTKAYEIIKLHGESPGCYGHDDMVNVDCGSGLNLLSMAHLRGDTDFVSTLVDMGASYDMVDTYGLTPTFWKALMNDDNSNEQVAKVESFIAGNFQSKLLTNIKKPEPEYDSYDKNGELLPKMSFGYGSKISDEVLDKLKSCLSKNYSLLGFINKLDKYIGCSKSQLAQLLWEAKVNMIAKIASAEELQLQPVHMISLHLFSMDNAICLEVNKNLSKMKDIDPMTTYTCSLYQSLSLLPAFHGECYRKVPAPFYYPIGTDIDWSSFGVCTTEHGTLSLEKTSTVFIVKSKTGRKISNYSKYPQNGEVVFLPGTKFKVTNYFTNSPTVFGQANIRKCSYGAKDHDIQRVVDGKDSLIVELTEV